MKELNALLFSAEEYLPCKHWTDMHNSSFRVEMPTGLAYAPLLRIIYSPMILNATVDGILIADHLSYAEHQINTAARVLGERNKELYAVSNGTDAILCRTRNQFRGKVDLNHCIDSPILKILANSRHAMSWLYRQGTTDDVPSKYADSLKTLERLGLVTKRNKTISLRCQRLRRVLEHEKNNLRLDYSVEELLSSILLIENDNPCASGKGRS